jgi:hypothetical protein
MGREHGHHHGRCHQLPRQLATCNGKDYCDGAARTDHVEPAEPDPGACTTRAPQINSILGGGFMDGAHAETGPHPPTGHLCTLIASDRKRVPERCAADYVWAPNGVHAFLFCMSEHDKSFSHLGRAAPQRPSLRHPLTVAGRQRRVGPHGVRRGPGAAHAPGHQQDAFRQVRAHAPEWSHSWSTDGPLASKARRCAWLDELPWGCLSIQERAGRLRHRVVGMDSLSGW